MNAQERFIAVCTGQERDRLPIIEWAPWWTETIHRWQEEGLPKTFADEPVYNIGVQRFFGLDLMHQCNIQAQKPGCPQEATFGAGIAETEEDYEKLLPYLYPEPHLDEDLLSHLRSLQNSREGCIVWYTLQGYFWFPREIMGIENHLYSFYDQPEFYQRICHDLLNWQKKVICYCADKLKFTHMSFAEDMSYNNGPMLSEEMFNTFLAPYYQELMPLVRQTGVLPFIDSDGDITKAVDWYTGVGTAGMFPLERKAGVDVSLYIDKHPETVFLGHFDKLCMKHGEAAMRQEFERLLPSAHRGRLLISVDHQTPPEVSLEQYRTFIRLFNEYAKR